MRYEYRDLTLGEARELIEYLLLSEGVESRRRLVKYEYLGVLIKGSGNRELLPLTYRELAPRILKHTCKWGVIALGECLDKRARTRA